MMAKCFCPVFFLLYASLFLPASLLATESIPALRERIQVLDQARAEADQELVAKKQQKEATKQDVTHHETVTRFLNQQIDATCLQLAASGGSTSGLPCSNPPIQKNKNTPKKKNKPLKSTQNKQPDQNTVSINKETSIPVHEEKVQPQGAEPARTTLQKTPPPEKPAGFFATIAQWLKSLFMPKPPMPTAPSQSSNTQQAAESSQTEKKASPSQQQTAVNKKPTDMNSSAKSKQTGTTDRKRPGGRQNEQTGKGSANQNKNKGRGQSTDQGKNKERKQLENGNISATKNQQAHTGIFRDRLTGAHSATKTKQAKSGANSGVQTTKVFSGGSRSKKAENREKNGFNKTMSAAHQVTRSKDNINKHATASGSGPKGTQKKPPTSTVQDVRGDVSKLEHDLHDALGEFDGTLIEARERLSARIPSRREGGESGNYGREDGEGLNSEQTGNSKYNGTGDAQPPHSSVQTNNPGGVAASGGQRAAGGRSTIGSDDDIVARQLREAAEKENDPVLKEKLWQEYKKYKAGKQ